jgi:hypothetical protein
MNDFPGSNNVPFPQRSMVYDSDHHAPSLSRVQRYLQLYPRALSLLRWRQGPLAPMIGIDIAELHPFLNFSRRFLGECWELFRVYSVEARKTPPGSSFDHI